MNSLVYSKHGTRGPMGLQTSCLEIRCSPLVLINFQTKKKKTHKQPLKERLTLDQTIHMQTYTKHHMILFEMLTFCDIM